MVMMSSFRAMPACSACGGCRILLEQPIERVRRLRALALPVVEATPVDGQRPRRIERADVLDELAVARPAVVSDHDSIERRLLGAMTGEANMNGHAFPRRSLLNLRGGDLSIQDSVRQPPNEGGT